MSGVRERPGRAERFEALIRPCWERLYRTAYRWTRSVEDAEDLVQEACVRGYSRLDELEGLDRPESWLMRVMYRLFVDATRRHDTWRVVRPGDAVYDNVAGDEPGPERIAEQAQASDRLAGIWQRVDRDNRALVVLHDVEGYTLAELTELTGLKEGTLKSRLHRTRVLLGRLLEQDQRVVPLRTADEGRR